MNNCTIAPLCSSVSQYILYSSRPPLLPRVASCFPIEFIASWIAEGETQEHYANDENLFSAFVDKIFRKRRKGKQQKISWKTLTTSQLKKSRENFKNGEKHFMQILFNMVEN